MVLVVDMIIRLILCALFLPSCSAHAATCAPGDTYYTSPEVSDRVCYDVSSFLGKGYRQCYFKQIILKEITIKAGPVSLGKKYQCSFCYKCKE